MNPSLWILALVTATLWVGAWMLFFKRDLLRWLKQRPGRRAERQAAALREAEAHARHLDELASKYKLPKAPVPPQA